MNSLIKGKMLKAKPETQGRHPTHPALQAGIKANRENMRNLTDGCKPSQSLGKKAQSPGLIRRGDR